MERRFWEVVYVLFAKDSYRLNSHIFLLSVSAFGSTFSLAFSKIIKRLKLYKIY